MALPDDERIIGLGGLIAAVADVGHHDGIIHTLHLLEVLGSGISHIRSVVVAQLLAVHVGNQAGGIDVDAEERHTLVAHGLDPIGLEQAVERRGAEVIVCADLHRIHVAIVLSQFLHAVVKLMIAHDNRVIAQRIHQRILHLATI